MSPKKIFFILAYIIIVLVTLVGAMAVRLNNSVYRVNLWETGVGGKLDNGNFTGLVVSVQPSVNLNDKSYVGVLPFNFSYGIIIPIIIVPPVVGGGGTGLVINAPLLTYFNVSGENYSITSDLVGFSESLYLKFGSGRWSSQIDFDSFVLGDLDFKRDVISSCVVPGFNCSIQYGNQLLLSRYMNESDYLFRTFDGVGVLRVRNATVSFGVEVNSFNAGYKVLDLVDFWIFAICFIILCIIFIYFMLLYGKKDKEKEVKFKARIPPES